MKDWQESRQRRALTVSASQISTAHLCIRKWWEERVRRLQKRGRQDQFIFGSVFHACVERFLLADDTGRDKKTGKPVDLFPDGWKSDFDPYTGELAGTVSEEEAGIIKALVLKGIESGVLAPYPERQVEREIRVPLGKIDAPNGPVTVSFMGFIDCASRNMIVDHKTTSNMRYALSANKLAEDPQMTIYGKMWLDHLRSLGERHDTVVLRHNQFCKDAKKLQVRSTETTVSADYIEQMWVKQWMPTIEKMVRYRDTANKWSDMPEPASGANACNKYGGCEYMNICGGRISEEQMQKRLDKNLDRGLDKQPELVTLTVSPNTRNNNMGQSLQEKLAALKASKQAAAAGTKPEPKAKVEEKPEPAKVEADANGMTPPPWAQAGCTPCGGLGFNTKGNPCKVCGMKADADKKPELYAIEAMADGSFVWASTRDEDEAGMSPGPSFNRAEPAVTERVRQEVVEEAPKPKATAKTTPAATEGVEDIDPKEAATTEYGFTLMINCRPTKSGRGIPKPFDLHDILDDAKNKMAEASGVPSFFDLDPFKRRDKIAELAPQVATALGKGVIFACGLGTDMSESRALLDGLKPLAKQVIISDVN